MAAQAAEADPPQHILLEAMFTMPENLTEEEVAAFGNSSALEIDHAIEANGLEFQAPRYIAGPQTIGFDRFDDEARMEMYERYFTLLIELDNPMLTILSYRLINVYTGDLGKMTETKNPMLIAWLFTEWATASEEEFLDWYTAYVTTDALDFSLLVDDFRADSTLAKYRDYITRCERDHLGGKVIDPELWIALRYRVCLAGDLVPRDYFTPEEIALGEKMMIGGDDNNYSDDEDDDGAVPAGVPDGDAGGAMAIDDM